VHHRPFCIVSTGKAVNPIVMEPPNEYGNICTSIDERKPSETRFITTRFWQCSRIQWLSCTILRSKLKMVGLSRRTHKISFDMTMSVGFASWYPSRYYGGGKVERFCI
jgi:hypothetical protein